MQRESRLRCRVISEEALEMQSLAWAPSLSPHGQQEPLAATQMGAEANARRLPGPQKLEEEHSGEAAQDAEIAMRHKLGVCSPGPPPKKKHRGRTWEEGMQWGGGCPAGGTIPVAPSVPNTPHYALSPGSGRSRRSVGVRGQGGLRGRDRNSSSQLLGKEHRDASGKRAACPWRWAGRGQRWPAVTRLHPASHRSGVPSPPPARSRARASEKTEQRQRAGSSHSC